jgi:hypothetical protein
VIKIAELGVHEADYISAWDKLAQIKKLEQEVKDIKRSTDPINK